jgi:hypothetical protein
MTTIQLRKDITKRLRVLSPERLRVVDDLVAYLQDREENPATRELLAISGLKSAVRRAEKQAAEGKAVPLAKVRRDV